MNRRETNKQNALKSTGPRITTRTRYNAISHGIFIEELELEHELGFEKNNEISRFKQEIMQDLAPKGLTETLLAEKIMISLWRLKRVYRAENASIREELDETPTRTTKALDLHLSINLMDKKNTNPLMPLDMIEELIEKKKAEQEEDSSENKELEEAIKFYERLKQTYYETLANNLEINTSKALTTEKTETYLRYETTIERQLYKALHELERLQAKRMGVAHRSVDVNLSNE